MENKQLNIPNTMVQKHFYETPESEVLLARFEENFMTSPTTDDFGQEDDNIFGNRSYNPNRL